MAISRNRPRRDLDPRRGQLVFQVPVPRIKPAIVSGVQCRWRLRGAHCCRVDTPLGSFVEHVENPTDNTRRHG